MTLPEWFFTFYCHLSIILAILLVSQGVVQTFDPYATAQTIEGASQIIPLGPVASQEAIKMLGSNGGGFFNVNSAHPFENPNGFTNFLETLAITIDTNVPGIHVRIFS